MNGTFVNFAAAGLLIVALPAALIGCSKQETSPSVDAARPAKIVTVATSSNRRDLTFPAVVRAARSAELTFQVTGEIKELNVLEGQQVEQGVVIAKLDQRNAKNNVAQARAEYENAEAEYQRARRLVEQDAISRSVLDSRKTQRDVARVALGNAEKALADTVIAAPFAGAISKVYPQQFQNVQAKEPIAVIQSNQVEAVVNVPGTIIARIPQLEPVGTRVVLDAAPGVEIPAEFKEASGLADESTQTYEISFVFAPPDNLLILPGMTASVRSTFVFNGAKDIVADGFLVPLSAILAEGAARFVWIVDPETGIISKRPVSVASEGGEDVTILEGVNENEQIIAAGVSFFHDGMKVRPWTPE